MYLNQMRTERNTASRKERYQSHIEPYTDEQLEIFCRVSSATVRGNVPRYWEDVQIGDQPTPLTKGPLTMSDVVAFKMGWGSHFVHHIRANEHRYWYVKRHPDLPIRNRLNVPDCPEAVHSCRTPPRRSAGRVHDYGPQREGWFGQLVTNWMGDAAQMLELRVALRKPNLEGDVQWIKGKVTSKEIDGDGRHVAGLELWSENQHQIVTSTGKSTVHLPSKAAEIALNEPSSRMHAASAGRPRFRRIGGAACYRTGGLCSRGRCARRRWQTTAQTVIKVEPPAGGVQHRQVQKHLVDGQPAYFSGVNRNKSCIAIDLSKTARSRGGSAHA